MWTVSADQAVEMYARFCRARYGDNALSMIDARVAEFRQSGDADGERTWLSVKRAVQAKTAPSLAA